MCLVDGGQGAPRLDGVNEEATTASSATTRAHASSVSTALRERPLPRLALHVPGSPERLDHRRVRAAGIAEDAPAAGRDEDAGRLVDERERVAAAAEFGQHAHVEDRSLVPAVLAE